MLRETVERAVQISLGVGLVVFGLAFFMEGVRLGLIAFAERIGAGLPHRASLPFIFRSDWSFFIECGHYSWIFSPWRSGGRGLVL